MHTKLHELTAGLQEVAEVTETFVRSTLYLKQARLTLAGLSYRAIDELRKIANITPYAKEEKSHIRRS